MKAQFDGVFGATADFKVKKTTRGYTCFINGMEIPSVLSQKLVLGDKVPTVTLEIAVRSYESDII